MAGFGGIRSEANYVKTHLSRRHFSDYPIPELDSVNSRGTESGTL
jgi:hypothetical protein